MKREWLRTFLALGMGILLVMAFALAVRANVDEDWDWPKGAGDKLKRELKYCVEGDDSDFEDDVDSAAEAWNNKGLGWTLTKVDDCDEADITVKQEDMGGADKKGRITLGSCLIEGDEGAWQGEAEGGTIRINSNEAANWGDPENKGERNRVRTIMHEFGHAMRLDHTHGANDIMKQSTSTLTGTAISDQDRREARTAVSYTIGGAEVTAPVSPTGDTTTIEPKPGAKDDMNIRPDTVKAITITPFFPVMEIWAEGWETDTIYAFVNVFSPEAGHHEGATVTIQYTDDNTASYHAEFVITDKPYTPTLTPQAAFVMTPTGVAAAYGLVRLDASPSSHMNPDAERFIYSWEIADQHSDRIFYTYHEYGAAFLPAGDYTVTLVMEDHWGQEARAAQSLTVRHFIYLPLVMRNSAPSTP